MKGKRIMLKKLYELNVEEIEVNEELVADAGVGICGIGCGSQF